ncbi:MAG TPA: sugar ABC transporter permease [Candidatus Dormibacteraeota bacterium]
MSAVETKPPRATSRRRFGVPAGAAPRARRSVVPRRIPYLLLAPAVLVMAATIGYAIVNLILISFQHFRARELILGLPTSWVGFDNYRYILGQQEFRDTLIRTLAFTAVNVVATIALGLGIALLMRQVGRALRVLLATSMVLAWAIPVVTATQVFQWLFDRDFGVVNWVLTQLHIGNFQQHSWLSNPVSLLGIATLIVVWAAVPFVALTLYAGLTQIPEDLYEAARVDGANAFSQLRSVTLPLLAPILLILALLSTIWDFRVFTQVFVLQKSGGISSDTNLIGIWAYHQSFGGSPNYGRGAATSVVGAGILLIVTAFAVRRMVRMGGER